MYEQILDNSRKITADLRSAISEDREFTLIS